MQERYFWGYSRVGGGGGGLKTPRAPYNLPEISYNDETRHSYTVPKEDPKNM